MQQIGQFTGLRAWGLFVVMLAIVNPPVLGQISVDSWSLDTIAREGANFPSPTITESTVSVPVFNLTRSLSDGTTPNVSTAETMYDFSVDGDQGSFQLGFDHERAGTEDSDAQGHGQIDFSVLKGLEYNFDGGYGATGSLRVFLHVELTDLSESSVVFRSAQESLSTSNETFLLGGLGGDSLNRLVGSPAGSLVSGHEYSLYYNYFISAFNGSDSGATATGFLDFAITPEPGTMGLLAVGGWALLRRRGR